MYGPALLIELFGVMVLKPAVGAVVGETGTVCMLELSDVFVPLCAPIVTLAVGAVIAGVVVIGVI